MVRQAGFEPTTPWFVARYSIQLSYWRTIKFAEAEYYAHFLKKARALRKKNPDEAFSSGFRCAEALIYAGGVRSGGHRKLPKAASAALALVVLAGDERDEPGAAVALNCSLTEERMTGLTTEFCEVGFVNP